MIDIYIDEQFAGLVIKNQLKKVISSTIETCGKKKNQTDLTVTITDNEAIQNLNATYRKINAPTDVLSFEALEINPENGHLYLGDIVISYPRAMDQAIVADHPIEVELSLLAVHGCLHLLGYDHATLEEKNEMWQLQDQVLSKNLVFPKQLPET